VSNRVPAAPPQGRIAQIRETFKFTRKADPTITWVLLGVFLGTLAIVIGLGFLFHIPWILGILALPLALLATTFVFGRRAEKAAYAQVEGQIGAAASVLNTLRAGWFVTPAVGVTKSQDLVHRVVGRPGVILVSEGPSSRVTNLLANEKKRMSRFVGETPIYEIQSGNDEGQIPLGKLQREVMKLPKNLKPGQVTELRRRLDALTTSPLPIPKGPLPKGARIPRG
jgi:hypothetical protein